MQRSAAARMRCFSAPENRRYLATATTSGLGGVASAAPFALRALGTAEAESKLSFMEVFINGVMSRSCLCTLNCPRQVSHLILARGGIAQGSLANPMPSSPGAPPQAFVFRHG